jgi:hypothetical protein
MALDKAVLAAALKTAFQAGLDDPSWSIDDAANAMADAIDGYVRAAEVVSVTTDVTDLGGMLIGHGVQTGAGALT